MNTILTSSIASAFAILLTSFAHAVSIDHSTITEVVKDATVLQPSTKGKKAARVNDVFAVPDVLRTGVDSRVEMVAEDQTVTRVGANTIFSFEPEKREINLQKGSVLFNSPTGKGGGTIRTAAATAAVQGTTLIVVTTQNGGFKVLLLEGHGSVKAANGQTRAIAAGQMVYALPGGELSGVLTFHLAEQIGVSRLVGGFKKPLQSIGKIEAAISKQNLQIAKGQLTTTGLMASDSPTQAYKVDTTIAVDVIQEQNRAAAARTVAVVQPISSAAEAGVTDAIIAQPQLETDRVYISGKDTPSIFGAGTSIAQSVPAGYTLFIARNTTVETSTINLSPYSGSFVFFATGDFTVEKNLSITGGLDEVGIVARGSISQDSGAFIDIDAKQAFVDAVGEGQITGNSLPTGSGIKLVNGGIRSSGDLSLFGSSFSLNGSTLTAGGSQLEAFSLGDFNATGKGTGTPQFIAPSAVYLSASNDMTISNSATSATAASFYAGNNMTLTNVAFLTSGGSASNVNLNAVNAITLNGANFQAQSVSLDARTLALTNVAFSSGSQVTLRSQTGLLAPNPNTNQPVQLGKVNFIQNVTYGGSPAQNAIRSGNITISK